MENNALEKPSGCEGKKEPQLQFYCHGGLAQSPVRSEHANSSESRIEPGIGNAEMLMHQKLPLTT